MTAQLGIRELRDTLTATIRRVRAGEVIEITHHHQPVAMLSPPRVGRIDQLLAASDIATPTPLDRPIRRYAPVGAVTASDALQDDRAER
jgi:antitoxin (DNA-binding transcriptional repressor) of toxin-antitoxin stability system